MKQLTELDELVLCLVRRLKGKASTLSILHQLIEVSGLHPSIYMLYKTLGKLEKHGWLKARYGEATVLRNGHRKRYYQITRAGHRLLQEYYQLHLEVVRQ